jgi:hypothetical protein
MYSTKCEVDYFHLVAFFPAESVSVAPKSKVKAEINYQALLFYMEFRPPPLCRVEVFFREEHGKRAEQRDEAGDPGAPARGGYGVADEAEADADAEEESKTVRGRRGVAARESVRRADEQPARSAVGRTSWV